MTDRATHPNTKAILNAWTRLSADETGRFNDPKVSDFPNLLGNLFVLKQVDAGIWPFTNAGNDLGRILGRELVDQNFITLWRGRDMELISAQLDAIRFSGMPGIIHAQAETLAGRQVAVEIALAPIIGTNGKPDRILGLYQMLESSGELEGRPVWRHGINALFPPEQQRADNIVPLFAMNE